jgi:5'-nucleotidase/UDP-sugar diphosphatase
MKRMLRIACLLVLLLSVTAWGETLTILHLNDTHAHLLAYGPKDAGGNGTWGGMARVASLVGMNKMTEPNVMLLHSGDFFVGDFMFQKYLGIPELEIMKQLGYDAVELGNHEFDLYPSTLKYVLDQAGFPSTGFPVLCANLDYSADPEMGYFVKPYIIKQYGSVKVGIFGLLTDFTNAGSNVAPDNVIAPLSVAQAWIDSLKIGHGCNVVILLSHLGVDMDQMVAGTTHGIDVIVGGHTHTQLNQPIQIGPTLILQAGEFAHYLGKLHLYVTGGAITNWDYQLIPVEAPIPAEPTVSGLLAGLAAGVEADPRFGPVYTQTVAKAAIDLDKDFGHGLCMDNPMGNLIADAFRHAASTDIAIQPQGFINQQVWAGPVVGNEVFQAVPYGFDQTSGLGLKLATFQTDGASLIAGLEFSVYNLPYLEDFFLHASNLTFAYNSSNPPGARVDYASIMVNGKPLDPSKSYTVAVPDGVVPFLSQIPGFNMLNLSITNGFMYTVVKDYMTARSPVRYYREGRILDLAVLSDPLKGTDALSDMVGIYRADGAIKRQITADLLQRGFAGVEKSLNRGRTIAALLQLCVIKLEVTIDARCGAMSTQSANTLKYLICQLMESIKHDAGITWKEGDELADAPLPESYELLQNYPNPFNPTTEIEFALPQTSNVTVTIYNTLGQQVQQLIDEPMPAGHHAIEWNGTDAGGHQVASGVYFYRISAGDFTSTKKMVLMK